jgi:hypothetical protein
MKRTYLLILVLLIMATSAFAGKEIVLSDYDVTMQLTDSETVSVCMYQIEGNTITNLVDESIQITDICKDINGNGYCFDSVDVRNPSYFTVTPANTRTGSSGCATIQIRTNGATQGIYSYKVNGIRGALVEVGTATAIPEFTTVGAAVAILGAGLVYYNMKKTRGRKGASK